MYAGPFFSDFTFCFDLINLLELHKIVFILWFTRPHMETVSLKIVEQFDKELVHAVKSRPKLSTKRIRRYSRDSSKVISQRNRIPCTVHLAVIP